MSRLYDTVFLVDIIKEENNIKNAFEKVKLTYGTEEERNLFYLYEFSDNYRLVSDSSIFPSMLNYVKTGLLTQEEMVEVLLRK